MEQTKRKEEDKERNLTKMCRTLICWAPLTSPFLASLPPFLSPPFLSPPFLSPPFLSPPFLVSAALPFAMANGASASRMRELV
ncbi:hypothetical protein CMQ_4380 [Grosmannia clavigera kw1407]|uniref:Uncharacterized protein n=1 Tax=Grosmannia clavigera (strain kw1407 / UAMH 11150) TaxID=655863 RepID=F0XUC1_GROCL|nr:uncharacterized protein CMQ_4380 [Grosmannia clavigera kw1407]EFW98528.1 hypothetical protein CMQ_4380 [Grosmannia clavigera kw1407]